MVHLPGTFLQAGHRRIWVAAQERQANEPRSRARVGLEVAATSIAVERPILLQDQRHPVGAEVDAMVRSARDELHPLLGLALIGFKVKRQVTKAGDRDRCGLRFGGEEWCGPKRDQRGAKQET